MNCPSRVDPDAVPNGWNQSPNALSLHKNDDLNIRANLTEQRDHRIPLEQPPENEELAHSSHPLGKVEPLQCSETRVSSVSSDIYGRSQSDATSHGIAKRSHFLRSSWPWHVPPAKVQSAKVWAVVTKYARFIGPGFMIAVAYIDPGNYATDIAAGASYRFQLLVMVLVSNLTAIFLQSLCIKLGSVTGLDLAQNIKAHCPPWLNYLLWFFAECAIIATDISEVIGTAIALNLLFKIPLVGGCAISIVDVLIILIFYRPGGSMRGLRAFEFFVVALVLGVFVCFCIELSLVTIPDVGSLFRGYAPSSALVQAQGLYQSCGILGATVMPHSLYLGSGLVQPRLKEYDVAHGNVPSNAESSSSRDRENEPKYRPSLAAIRSCMSWSIAELAISLGTFALFINSAILIVAGAALADIPDAQSASLFSIHDLFSKNLAPFAGTVFALALLLSGTSAGIVCTLAGQIVSEGQLNWSVKPWVRRLMVRSISITPSIIVAGAIGKEGVSAALQGTQFALSVILPFTSAPLIYFTCRNKYMTVDDSGSPAGVKKMRNGWLTATIAIVVWFIIVIMNVAALVLTGTGAGVS